MVNIAADIRATSDCAPSSAGSANPSVSTNAPRNPSAAANTMVQALAVLIMPTIQTSIRTPQAMKGQALLSSLPAIPRSTNEAGSWPKLSAVSVAPIRSTRPAPVREPGRNAWLQKYTLLMAPKMKLIFQISGLLQSGQPLVGPCPLLDWVFAPPGARRTVSTAIAISGMPQIASAQRQELTTSGRTTGIVNITASASPTRRPLV